jgi:hypothetical protein
MLVSIRSTADRSARCSRASDRPPIGPRDAREHSIDRRSVRAMLASIESTAGLEREASTPSRGCTAAPPRVRGGRSLSRGVRMSGPRPDEIRTIRTNPDRRAQKTSVFGSAPSGLQAALDSGVPTFGTPNQESPMVATKKNPKAVVAASPPPEGASQSLERARAVLADAPVRATRVPVPLARLARITMLLLTRLALEPYRSRLKLLPEFVLSKSALSDLEVLARAAMALPGPRHPSRRPARPAAEAAKALRDRLRRGLPRCFDRDDPVYGELSGLGRPGGRPMLDDLNRLHTALSARPEAWKPYPQFMDPADVAALPGAVAALEKELDADDPFEALERSLRAGLFVRFRRVKRIAQLVVADDEVAPALPRLLKRRKKKGGEDSTDAKAKAEAEKKTAANKKGKGGASAAPEGEAAEADAGAGPAPNAKGGTPAPNGKGGSATPSVASAKPSPSKPSSASAEAGAASTPPRAKIESVEADAAADSDGG